MGKDINNAEILKEIAIKLKQIIYGIYSFSLFLSHTKKAKAKAVSLRKLFLPIVSHWIITGEVRKVKIKLWYLERNQLQKRSLLAN